MSCITNRKRLKPNIWVGALTCKQERFGFAHPFYIIFDRFVGENINQNHSQLNKRFSNAFIYSRKCFVGCKLLSCSEHLIDT